VAISSNGGDKLFRVLLVEDNPGDVRLIREGLNRNNITPELNVAENGSDAMAYLRRENGYARATRPDIILLDLNLPGMDGQEVLVEIKSDTKLKIIPVVILTSSKAQQDIINAYNNNANCYISKPKKFEGFLNYAVC